jgi:hypothetical protein
MNNQPPVSIVAARPADHLKRHSDVFVQNGPGMMTQEQRATRQRKIELCADRMAASKTYDQFEAALGEGHRLGAYPYNGDVTLVAHASFFAD